MLPKSGAHLVAAAASTGASTGRKLLRAQKGAVQDQLGINSDKGALLWMMAERSPILIRRVSIRSWVRSLPTSLATSGVRRARAPGE
jgi:hypothetical protein